MNTLIIPFLLGAQLVQHEQNSWPHGAEYTFNCRFGATISKHIFQYTATTSCSIKCRVKNETTIRCQFTEVNSALPMKLGIAEDDQINTEDMKIPFELNFDASGVKNITVLGRASAFWLNGLRRIALLLTVGTDLREHAATDEFQASETLMLGNCNTTFRISRQRLDDLKSDEDTVTNYELTSPLISKGRHSEDVTIERSRDPHQCDKAAEYLLPMPTQIEINFTSYVHKMHMTSAGIFKSRADMRGTQSVNFGVKTMFNFHNFVSIELENIEAATEPLAPAPSKDTTTVTMDQIIPMI